jgi:hypothetical protein
MRLAQPRTCRAAFQAARARRAAPGLFRPVENFWPWGRKNRLHRPALRSKSPAHEPLGRGEVPEWSNGAVSKTVVGASPPRVRIPVSPPLNQHKELILKAKPTISISRSPDPSSQLFPGEAGRWRALHVRTRHRLRISPIHRSCRVWRRPDRVETSAASCPDLPFGLASRLPPSYSRMAARSTMAWRVSWSRGMAGTANRCLCKNPPRQRPPQRLSAASIAAICAAMSIGVSLVFWSRRSSSTSASEWRADQSVITSSRRRSSASSCGR